MSFWKQRATPIQTPSRTYVVTPKLDATANDQRMSLREAVLAANASPSLDRMSFANTRKGSTTALPDRVLWGSLTSHRRLLKNLQDFTEILQGR